MSSTSPRRCSKRPASRSPTFVNGVQQSPYEGTSMLYSFNDAGAAERHETQYFEMFCNRGIYHKGWSAVTKHRTPWEMKGGNMPRVRRRCVGALRRQQDWTQAKNLAREMPEKLHELQRLWLIEAVKYNVLPLDDRQFERFIPELAGRPQLIKGNTQILFAGMGRLIREQRRHHQKQVVRCHGRHRRCRRRPRRRRDHRSGRPLWRLEPVREGRQSEVPLQLARHQVVRCRGHAAHSGRQDTGAHGVRVRRRRHRQRRHRHALRDGKEAARAESSKRRADFFSADETTDIGYESGTTVSPDYTAHTSRFNGKINWVQIDLGDEKDADHYISAEERLRVAMARQ